MVHFNELRITDDGKYLIIDAAIDDLDWFANNYITSVAIDVGENYSAAGPSSDAKVIEVAADSSTVNIIANGDVGCSKVYAQTEDEECISECCIGEVYQRKIHLELKATDLGFDLLSHIYFVYVNVGGTPSPSTPCGYDVSYEMGVVYNARCIYNTGMLYMKQLADECAYHKGFQDFILRYAAFKLALETGNYEEAVTFWHNYLQGERPSTKVESKGCGCHGNR